VRTRGTIVRGGHAPVVIGLALMLALLGSVAQSLAQTAAGPVARAVSVQGVVEARRAGQAAWQTVKLNDQFSPGDTIRVQDRSRADIAMLDQSVLRLNANTELTVEPVKDQRTGVVRLLRGATHFFSRGPRSLEVQTPFTVAGIRGTEFYIGLEPAQAVVIVFEGTVLAANPVGSLTLTGGQAAVAEAGKAPVGRVIARPRDAVQWTLHYPPVLNFRPDEFPAGPDWQGMVRQSIEAHRRGDLAGAFAAIATVPPTVGDPRFFAYRAHLLLAVGRVDEAAADIERAVRLAPDDPNALALQTIIAVAQGDKDRALATAQRAVQAAPNAAAAHLALSYAQQARFDLEGARKSVETAVGLEPQNALAWARLSELWASFGELGQALRAAQRAEALEPDLSRTQTVLGYAYLMQVKTTRAREAFTRAIVLDQADPLPRLGLGLARIRDGELHEGGREIEVAASLDPSNAIVRSYLGKTYYEEKRTGLDQREYEMAKQLDPADPTPYFYGAIAKQTTNRPVEALHEMQRAIELNDNRAVYRSRLLLDADEASRSASLARIYSNLGFEQLALVEGWKSVNVDPTNFSAHRFLADSYAALPRHQIARVSELLQSQLLQPLNITPIQPRLAESNLFLISSLGPGTLSFNEFNPIFNRDRVALQASGLVGSNETYAGEGTVAGIYKNLSFSAGYTHFETDGFRPNNHQTDDLVNAFVQLELDPRVSVQAEYRYRDLETGDLKLNFFPDDFSRFFTERTTSHTYRVGGRYAHSPASILLASVAYQRLDRIGHDEPTAISAIDSSEKDQTGASGELQHLFRSRYVNLVTGVGYFRVTGDRDLRVELNLPPPIGPILTEETLDQDTSHLNLYMYSYLSPLRSLTFTLGLSGDIFESERSDSENTSQVNPKFGVIWNPFASTTVRAAVFRVLRRTLLTDQTLEPTQVGGFNQFFDDNDIPATTSWRYGVGIDQKITSDLYGGIEVSKRDLSVPFEDLTVDPSEVRRADWDEELARAYLFWTPHPWLALRAAYQYERLEREEEFTLFLRELETHKVPLGVGVFHPSGLGGSFQATYHHQEGVVFRQGGTDFESGTSSFWLLDVALSYRLPRRYGFVTVGVSNLLDKQFRYQESDFKNPQIQPDRMVFGRVTVALP
jgi:tetratricopeptide (TPR) repeat protein/opacity protein-like surface antigen